jgi:hypothetical protein
VDAPQPALGTLTLERASTFHVIANFARYKEFLACIRTSGEATNILFYWLDHETILAPQILVCLFP